MRWFDKIKSFFEKGYWNKQMVGNAVSKKRITAEEYKEIVGEDYETRING